MGWTTIYQAKVAELREAIRAGKYANRPFPSETQLMRKFSVGRQTAVRILNRLADEGLIVRRKGAGNFLTGRGLRTTGRIGLIIHGSDYCEIFAPISKAVSALCQKHGYTLLFDDVQFAKLTMPQLTTMHQPCEEIAKNAFRLLLDRIRDPRLPARSVLLDSALVVRGSTSVVRIREKKGKGRGDDR